jgi:hypothetical protein
LTFLPDLPQGDSTRGTNPLLPRSTAVAVQSTNPPLGIAVCLSPFESDAELRLLSPLPA